MSETRLFLKLSKECVSDNVLCLLVNLVSRLVDKTDFFTAETEQNVLILLSFELK